MNLNSIAYIHRKHTEVDALIQARPFRDANHKYGEMYVLQDTAYNNNSKKEYEILKPLLVRGSTWTFIPGFETMSNSQGSMLVLIAQDEGDLTRKSRISAA